MHQGTGKEAANILGSMAPPTTGFGAASVGPYSAQQITLYVLLALDIVINATAEAQGEPFTRMGAIFVLAAQLIVRVACISTVISLLASSGSWHDEFLLRYSAVFVVSLAGLILCLFLRVFRVTLASFPSEFPTVLDYWGSATYCLLLLAHILLSLLFYYFAARSAHAMGSAGATGTPIESRRAVRPSALAAVQLASRNGR